jgi:cobalt/nickel transport system permease protein
MKTKESLKLINAFFYSFIVAFLPLELLFALPLALLLFDERNHLIGIIKKLILLNLFIVFLVVFVSFQDPQQAIELFIRTNIILLFNTALFYHSRGYDIARGLDALHFPSKIVSVMYFTLSLINALLLDFKEIKTTLRARGFGAKTSFFTYQTYGNLFGMIFIKALKKSEDINYCMVARGFENRIFFLNSNNIRGIEKMLFLSTAIIYLKVTYELFA